MEVWKPLIGFEGSYEISSEGRVKSLPRYIRYINGRVNLNKGRILKQRVRKDGYKMFNVSLGNVKSDLHTHIEVCKAFHGPRPPKMDACHGDGDRSNNRKDNLRWDTRKGNFGDMVAHGTRCRGERHGQVKLTDAQIQEIRSMDPAVARNKSGEYGVHRNSISRILRKERRYFTD